MIWIASYVHNFWLQNLLICFRKQTEIFCYSPISLDRFPKTDINQDVSCHVETVCLLSKRKPDTTVKLSVDMDDYYRIINGKDAE